MNEIDGCDFHSLCREGRLDEVTRALADIHFPINQRRAPGGRTALHEACLGGHAAVCSALLSYGVEYNTRTTEGRYTALHLAVHGQHADCIKVLLLMTNKCLKLDIPDSDGRSALQVASEKGYHGIVKLLLCGEIYQLSSKRHVTDKARSILRTLLASSRYSTSQGAAVDQAVHKLIDMSFLDATSANNVHLVQYLLQYGVSQENTLKEAIGRAKASQFTELTGLLILAHYAYMHNTDQVRYLLAPQLEVDNNKFLVTGEEQERNLVYPLHKANILNTGVIVKMAINRHLIVRGVQKTCCEDCLVIAGCVLRQTNCCTEEHTVDWHNLGLPLLRDDWLLADLRVYRLIHNVVREIEFSSGEWVTALNLSSNNFHEVPNAVCHLKNLTKLDLSENPIGKRRPATEVGSVPECATCCLPAELFSLPSLKELSLQKACLTELPDVPNWPRLLQILNLAENLLTTLPDSFGRGTKLVELNLADNKLREVPTCIGNLTSLEELNISGNDAIEVLPCELGRLSFLITLSMAMVPVTNIPSHILHRAPEIIRYLNTQLHDLVPTRVAKIVLVGQNRKLRRKLYWAMCNSSTRPTNVLDLGDVNSFLLFVRGLRPRFCRFVLAWDVEGDETLDDIEKIFMYLRKRVRVPDGVQFKILIAGLHRGTAREGEIGCKMGHRLGESDLLNQARPLKHKATIVDLEDKQTVEDLMCDIQRLNDDQEYDMSVPRSYIGMRDQLAALKRKVSGRGTLERRMWVVERRSILATVNEYMTDPVYAIAANRPEELDALLTFLQNDGSIANIRYPGSIFDDMFFLTPQWLFHSLLKLFGPWKAPRTLPRWCRHYSAGLYDREVFEKTMMNSDAGKLGKFAVPLAEYFGMAYQVGSGVLFLPYKLCSFQKMLGGGCLLAAVHSENTYLRFLSSGKKDVAGVPPGRKESTSRVPWPAGFFQLLQSYVMDSMDDLLTWRGAAHPIRSCVPDLDEVREALQSEQPEHDAEPVAVFRVGMPSNFSLSLWEHGIAAWSREKLVFAVFQKSSVPQAFHHVQLSGEDTVCVVVPHDGQKSVSRLARLVDIVYLVLDEVFNDEVFPYLINSSGSALSDVKQYVPCDGCTSMGSYIDSHRYSVEELHANVEVQRCPRHHGDLSSLQIMELLAPDILFLDVSQRYHCSMGDFISDDNILGEGQFAVVRRVHKANDPGTSFARKEYRQDRDVFSAYRKTRREIYTLREVSHHFSRANDPAGEGAPPRDECFDHTRTHPVMEFFVAFVGVCCSPLALHMEEAPCGSLNNVLFREQPPLSRLYLAAVAGEVVCALLALHTAGIVCRDIKANNILVFSTELRDGVHVKLTDFNTSVSAPRSGLVKVVGTRKYQAPELQPTFRPRFAFAIDIYSFGLFLYELFSGKRAFDSIDSGPIMAPVRAGIRPDVSLFRYGGHLHAAAAVKCWQATVSERPECVDLHRHLVQPESLLAVDHQLFQSAASIRHVMLIDSPSPAFVRSQFQLSVFRDSQLMTNVHMTAIKGTHSRGLLTVDYPEEGGITQASGSLPHTKVACVCLEERSTRLWIGTEQGPIYAVDYSVVPMAWKQIPMEVPNASGAPVAMAAHHNRVFAGLDTGWLITFLSGRHDGGHKIARTAVIDMILVAERDLWCLTCDCELHMVSDQGVVRRVRAFKPSPVMGTSRALCLVHAVEQRQVWLASRDCFKLRGWSKERVAELPWTAETSVLDPDVEINMEHDWARVVAEASPLIPTNIRPTVDSLRPRSMVIQHDVLWLGTAVGVVLLYRLSPPVPSSGQAAQQPGASGKFIGWVYMHHGPNSLLTSAFVNSPNGFSREVVISGGTSSPLFDKHGCHCLPVDCATKPLLGRLRSLERADSLPPTASAPIIPEENPYVAPATQATSNIGHDHVDCAIQSAETPEATLDGFVIITPDCSDDEVDDIPTDEPDGPGCTGEGDPSPDLGPWCHNGSLRLEKLHPCVVFWEACTADDMEKVFKVSRRCRHPFAAPRA